MKLTNEEERIDASVLRNLLIEVTSTYDRKHPEFHDQPAQIRLKESKTLLKQFAPLGFKIDGSGKKPQRLPLTPWIGFLNLDESKTFQEGIYVVYLFSQDLSRVYLSLNQGTEKMKSKLGMTSPQQISLLRSRAEIYRGTFSDKEREDLVSEIDLGNHKGRPRTYEAGNIVAVAYDTNSLPTSKTIHDDLQRLFYLYDRVLQNRNKLLLDGEIDPTGLENNPDKLEEAGLGGFKPKNASDYLAILPAYTLKKSRRHEALVKNFGEWVISAGCTASTPHPIDIFLEQAGKTWIVEAKIVYNLNYAQAVRGAIGQLFDYRHFLRADANLIALFDVEVGDAYLELLSSLQITTIWPHTKGWMVSKHKQESLDLPF